MAVIMPKSVFLRIPRTGSAWVRSALSAAGIDHKQVGYDHSPYVPPEHRGKLVFTFTRCPQRWLVSRWSMGAWQDSLSTRYDRNYDVFAEQVSMGDVWRYFGQYTERCDFVGAYESITDDLVRALRYAREKFDEDALRACAHLNNTKFPKKGVPANLMESFYWGKFRP